MGDVCVVHSSMEILCQIVSETEGPGPHMEIISAGMGFQFTLLVDLSEKKHLECILVSALDLRSFLLVCQDLCVFT